MPQPSSFIAWLGKQAAYKKPYLLKPTKRVTSHSKTVKPGEGEEEQALKASAGNVQPPYRYGRKVKKQ